MGFRNTWKLKIKVHWTEQLLSCDNCQSRTPVGTKWKLGCILFYFIFKVIYNDEVVKFYSPFPNKNNKKGSGENCCCELSHYRKWKWELALWKLGVMCKHGDWLHVLLFWWVREWWKGNCLPVTWDNVYKTNDSACRIPVLGEERWSGMSSLMLPMPKAALIHPKAGFKKSSHVTPKSLGARDTLD